MPGKQREITWLDLARELRRSTHAKAVAVAIEAPGVSASTFRDFLDKCAKAGIPVRKWPLEVGEACEATWLKGRCSVRITVTTEVDYAG